MRHVDFAVKDEQEFLDHKENPAGREEERANQQQSRLPLEKLVCFLEDQADPSRFRRLMERLVCFVEE